MQTAADVHMHTVTTAVERIRLRRAEDYIEILKHIGFHYGSTPGSATFELLKPY